METPETRYGLCNYCHHLLNPDEEREPAAHGWVPVLPITSRYPIEGHDDYAIIGVTNSAGCEHYREARTSDDGGDGPWWASLGDLQEAILDASLS